MKTMSKYIAIIALAFLLTGCPFVKTEYELRPVPVPVVVFSEVEPPHIEEMPALPIYSLDDQSSDEEIALAIDQSIIILEAYKEELLEAIRPFQEAYERNQAQSDEAIRAAVSRVQAALDSLISEQEEE